MNDAIDKINAPWLLWILAGSTVAYTVLRQAAESSTFVAQLLGPLGKRWADARAKRRDTATLLADLQSRVAAQDHELAGLNHDAWNQDLKRQVEALDRAVTSLRHRAQVTDAYLVYDESWHRRERLAYGSDDYVPTPHTSYLEFEADWINAQKRP